MKTETIIAMRSVSVNGIQKTIITTSTGHEVWASANQVSDAARTVSFVEHKAGDTVVANKDGKTKSGVVYKKGEQIKLESDQNEFKGVGGISFKEKLAAFKELDLLPTIAL